MSVTTAPAAVFFYSPDRAASMPSGISPDIAEFFRPMPMPGSIHSTSRIESRDRSWKPDAGTCETQAVLADIASKARRPKPTTISPIAFEAVQKLMANLNRARALDQACRDVDPRAWLADVLARIADHKITDLRRAAALELAPRDPCRPRRLSTAARASALTISRAAKILGEDEEFLWDMATDMKP